MIAVKNGNNRTWKSLQTVLLIVTLGFVFVDKILMPNVNSGKLADEIKAQAVAIGKLETLPDQVREIRALIINHMTNDREKK